MFSMCSELTPHACIPDTRIPQLMQPCGDYDDQKQVSPTSSPCLHPWLTQRGSAGLLVLVLDDS